MFSGFSSYQSVNKEIIITCSSKRLQAEACGRFVMCAKHGTNLAGASPVTGFYRQVCESQVGINNGMDEGSGMNVANFIISKELAETKIKDSAGMLNPLSYYLSNVGI